MLRGVFLTGLGLTILVLSGCSRWPDPPLYCGEPKNAMDTVMDTVSGCTYPGLVKITYDGPVGYTSDKTGSIQLSTGAVADFPPRLHFDLLDQRIFVESLKDELNRLKLLRVSQVSEQQIEGADVSINVVFLQAAALDYFKGYSLTVTMQLKAGTQSFSKRYEILPPEGYAKLLTTARSAKEREAEKLMATMIPDIEKFVSSLPSHRDTLYRLADPSVYPAKTSMLHRIICVLWHTSGCLDTKPD